MIPAKRDPSFEPLRVPADFETEFPGCEASATEVILNLTVVGAIAVNRVEELLAQYGLVLTGFNVLAVVDGAGGPLTPTVIAERSLIGKTTATSALDALERRGLVRRSPNPHSRRSVLVETTPDGTRTCHAILRRLHPLEATWMEGVSERDRQAFLRLLGLAKGLLSRVEIPAPPPEPDRPPGRDPTGEPDAR